MLEKQKFFLHFLNFNNKNKKYKFNKPYYNNNIQKRTISSGSSTITISTGLVGALTYLFLGATFSLILVGLGLDNLGGGASNLTTFNTEQDLIDNLESTLDHVNRMRRVNMSMIRDLSSVLSHRANVHVHNLTYVSTHYPDILDLYRNAINSLQNISSIANNTLLSQADQTQTNPHLVFEEIQDPLDILAGELEELIQTLDSNYQFESDTDDEKIDEAVKEHSLRHQK